MTDEKKRRLPGVFLLPNLITTAALFCGFYAIIASINSDFISAPIAILIAMVLDGLDGRIARLTNTQTSFGEYFDSLSDMVCFGLSPAILIYMWSASLFDLFTWQSNKMPWIICFIYIASVAIRLARFNSELSDKPVYAKNYFSGIPTPAAAFLLLLPITGVPIFELNEFKTEFYLSVWMTIIAMGMVSNLPTFSGKVMLVPRKFVIPFLIFLGILCHYIISDPTKGFTLLVIVYILTIPISPFFYYRLRSSFEKNKDTN